MQYAYSAPAYRRSYERLTVEATATLVIGLGPERPVVLKDLSSRGAGIVSNFLVNANQEVAMIMQVPYLFAHPVYRRVRVAWSNKIAENLWQTGLDFGLDNQIRLG